MPDVCPECEAGKHGNCDGTTWDNAADALTYCQCQDVNHPVPSMWVCDGCMATVTAGQVAVWADGEHVLCAECVNA